VPEGRLRKVLPGAVMTLLGAGLITWSLLRPAPVPYVIGVLLLFVALGQVLLTARRRQGQRGRRLLAAGVSLAVCAALLAAPGVARHRAATSDVLWRTQIPAGAVVSVGQHLYVSPGGEAAEEGDIPLQVLDPATGTVQWEGPGQADVATDGSVVHVADQHVTYIHPDGDVVWEAEVSFPGPQWVRVEAADAGHVVVKGCELTDYDDLDCTYRGLDRDGEEVWDRDFSIVSRDEQPWHPGAYYSGDALPERAFVVQQADGPLLVIDTSTGETVQELPQPSGRWQGQLRQDVLLTSVDSAGSCTLRADRLGAAGPLWQTTLCQDPDGTVFLPEPVDTGGEQAFALTDTADDDRGLRTINLESGQVRTVQSDEVGGPDEGSIDLYYSGTHLTSLLGRYAVDDQLLHFSGEQVVSTDAADAAELWKRTVPGGQIRAVVSGHHTVAVLSDAEGSNPYVPAGGDPAGRPARLSLLEASTGEVVASSLFPGGVDYTEVLSEPRPEIDVIAQHQVLVHSGDQSVLVRP